VYFVSFVFEDLFAVDSQINSVVFATLMMFAFLVDQIQLLSSALFQSALEKVGSRIRFWEHARSLFFTLDFDCMEDICRSLLYGFRTQVVILGLP